MPKVTQLVSEGTDLGRPDRAHILISYALQSLVTIVVLSQTYIGTK